MHPAPDAPKRPALRYYGGKWNLAPWVLAHFPPHLNYVEPCGGAASVLLQKPRSRLETYNDLDDGVVTFFRVLRDRPETLIRKVRLTPWARAEYLLSLAPCEDEVERARRFFVSMWMSLQGGHPGKTSRTWRAQHHAGRRGNCDMLYLQVENLERVSQRFQGVQIENRDTRDVIVRYDNADTLTYFDPPYLPETRTQRDQYRFEVDRAFHVQVADLLRRCAGYVVVSGYTCPLYAALYEAHGWQRVDRRAQTNSGGQRVESLWLSPRTWAAVERERKVRQPRLFGG